MAWCRPNSPADEEHRGSGEGGVDHKIRGRKQRLDRKPLQFRLRQHGIKGASMEAVSTQDMEALYRAAIGPKKADFYVPKFIAFDAPGASKLSWNWPAFFFSFYWFLYRRMYATWAIYSLLIPIGIGVASAIFSGSVGGDAGDLFYSVVTLGYAFGVIPLLANSFYHRSVKKRIEALREKVPETGAQLLVLDNTPPTSNIIWVIIPFAMVAILGILAAIAIPAYQTYTIRAQVSEAFVLSDRVKSAVVEHYGSEKTWPMGIQELNLSQPMSGRYVADLSVDHGTVSVTFGNQANSLIARHILSFRPLLTATGAIMWTCGHAVGTENADSAVGPNLTDVKPQFLPSDCR
jgi:type IV pilus assembly protein PilA